MSYFTHSFNKPKNCMLRACNSLEDFDYNFECESKLKHSCFKFKK